jgi:hypothetical protein
MYKSVLHKIPENLNLVFKGELILCATDRTRQILDFKYYGLSNGIYTEHTSQRYSFYSQA